jgi:hypothetical protein
VPGRARSTPTVRAGGIGCAAGGDPLAAALAAGETPSPEMVAAAGEAPRRALRGVAGLGGIVAGIAVSFAWARTSRSTRSSSTAEITRAEARDAPCQLVSPERSGKAFGFRWNEELVSNIRSVDKPVPRWDGSCTAPLPLGFRYRQSRDVLQLMFHTDLRRPAGVARRSRSYRA